MPKLPVFVQLLEAIVLHYILKKDKLDNSKSQNLP